MRGSLEAARELDGLLGQREPPFGVAGVVELQREPREQPRAQRAVLVAEPLERLLEEDEAARRRRGRGSTTGPRSRARRGRAAACRRAPGGRGGGAERGARLLLHPGAVLGGAEREQQLAADEVVRRPGQLARPQRRAVVVGRLLPGQQPVGAAGGGEREVDRPLGLLERRRLGEVMGELGQVRVQVRAAQARDRLADAAVQPRAAQLREPVVERRAHERVGERVAADRAGLAQHARLDALLERADQRVVVQRRDRLEHVVVELAADDGGDLERLARLGAQPPQAPRR